MALALRRTLPLGLALAALVLGGCRRGPRLIPRALLLGPAASTAAQISPDGQSLAWLAPVAGAANVWVRTLGAADDRALSAVPGAGVRGFRWAYDSRHILFTADAAGDENTHVWIADTRGSPPRDLTPWPEASQLLALSPEHPGEVLVESNRRDPRYQDVVRLDWQTGAARLDTRNPGDVEMWFADRHLEVRAALAGAGDGGSRLRVRLPGGDWQTRLAWAAEDTGTVFGFNRADSALWVATSVGAASARLLAVPLAGGVPRVLLDSAPFDVSGVVVSPATGGLAAASVEGDLPQWKFFDPALAAAVARLAPGVVTAISSSQDETRRVYKVEDGERPASWWLDDRGRLTRLFDERPALAGYPLARMQPVTFAARDGLTLHAYWTPAAGAGPHPLVLLVHGGPWDRDQWGWSKWPQWLASRGYGVLQVNFRGSSGFGKAYLDAGNRQWAGTMRTDLLDAKQWAERQGLALPGRTCIFGASYGGYAALAGLAFTPGEYACGVDSVGPSDLNQLLANLPPAWTAGIAQFRHRMGDDPAALAAASPLAAAGRIVAPLLVAQGARDPRVHPDQSDAIVAAVRAHGHPVEYLLFPDEGHGYQKRDNELAFTAAVEQFLAQHLGGAAEPPTAAEAAVLARVRR